MERAGHDRTVLDRHAGAILHAVRGDGQGAEGDEGEGPGPEGRRPAPLDFYSWHSYAGRDDYNPYCYYEYGMRVREALDKYGYTATENIVTEWNAGMGDVPVKESEAMPDGSVPFACSWAGEWDIVPGQNVVQTGHSCITGMDECKCVGRNLRSPTGPHFRYVP